MNLKTVLFAAMGLLLAACTQSEEVNSPDKNGQEENKTPGVEEIVRFELTSDESLVNDGLNDFGFKLINEVVRDFNNSADTENKGDGNGNIAVSPLSASIALGMLANTCDDEMEKAIAKMLGQKDLSHLNSTCNKLMEYLPERTNGGELLMANSAWYKEDLTPLKEWENAMASVFFAETKSIDFTDPKSVDVVNGWVSDHTKGLIKNVVDGFEKNTTCVLVNALYFLGRWQDEFDDALTKKELFHGKDGSSTVDMMHNRKNLGYVDATDFEMVELKFNGNTSMEFLLPKNGKDVTELMSGLTSEDYKEALRLGNTADVTLSLPRFKIETEMEITQMLHVMGMPAIAKLQKLGDNKDNVFMVNQFTNTSVNEKGAESAAATIIKIVESYMPAPKPQPVTMEFNRPFAYLIRNQVAGTVLMAGIVHNL